MTPLWRLAYQLWMLGFNFTALAARVSLVAVFGDLLAEPFRTVASVLFDAANFCWEADGVLLGLIAFWNDLRYGNLINDLLQRVFWRWSQLRTDPYGFVNDMVAGLFPGWGAFRADPATYIRNRLIDRWPELGPLLRNPLDWLRTRLEYNLGLGAGFFSDPLGAIKGWFYNRYPSLRNFFEDPGYWLRTQLRTRWGVDLDLLDDPTAWAWRRLIDSVERYAVTYLDWLLRIVADLANRAWTTKV